MHAWIAHKHIIGLCLVLNYPLIGIALKCTHYNWSNILLIINFYLLTKKDDAIYFNWWIESLEQWTKMTFDMTFDAIHKLGVIQLIE